MIGKVSVWRHLGVGVVVAGLSVLAGSGVIGGGTRPELFDAKTVVVADAGFGRIRITEYVDIDFGSHDRHGYERLIPNDFGTPTDVTASSPDADDGLNVLDFGDETRIRVGDPDRTFTGQHRYELSYTLPEVDYDALDGVPDLAVDIVAPAFSTYPGDQLTRRFEVIVTGFDLTDLRCDVGSRFDAGGCELAEASDGTYRVILEPLPEGAGLTVGGTIVEITDPVTIAPPPIPERRSDPNGLLRGLVYLVLGSATAIGVYLWARRHGRNEVFAGGAVDAAFGPLPPPGSGIGSPPVVLVEDEDMADLATIEFVPPKGIEPWEASLLLRERVDDESVAAWFSGLVGREAIVVEERDDDLAISSGPRRDGLDGADAELVDRVLALGDPYVTGKYDSKFATVWEDVRRNQRARVSTSGWWKRLPAHASLRGSSWATAGPRVVVAAVICSIWLLGSVTALIGLFQGRVLGLAFGAGFPALVALILYRFLLPARSALGSALALQAESFRRFLHASEGHHVEWAWQHGLLREYSAWAVALGEADAWSKALERANVPEPARFAATPLYFHAHAGSMNSSRTAPSSSGSSGGGGGFGGGGVGGGGGGGSSGSW